MKTVFVCVHQRANPAQPSCGAHGGLQIADRLADAITDRKLEIHLERFSCLGMCTEGPNIKLAPDGPFFSQISPGGINDLLREIERFIASSDAKST